MRYAVDQREPFPDASERRHGERWIALPEKDVREIERYKCTL